MPYIFLKNIIESVIANYVCPECNGKTNVDQLNITGMSSRGIDIHVTCLFCGLHSQLSAEINTMVSELLTSEHGYKFFNKFIKNGDKLDTTMINNKNKKWINELDIAQIDAEIQSAKTIEDLMG